LGLEPQSLRAEVFGLNHLSWSRAVWQDGRELLRPLLHDSQFQAGTLLRLFDPQLIKRIDMYLNEYLFYYYYRDEAVNQIQSKARTRGEEVAEWNGSLYAELERQDYAANPLAALEIYDAYLEQRSSTYMPYTYSDRPMAVSPPSRLRTSEQEGEGYAGVALDIMQALETGEPLYTALNVPSEGTIPGMEARDVVEVSCRVDGTGVHPLPIGEVPHPQLLLMKTVKLYECLTVSAVANRSRDEAVFALMNHPLVQSYSLAGSLVDEYLSAHRQSLGDW
jgi:6-phospho-beta-glucosidase